MSFKDRMVKRAAKRDGKDPLLGAVRVIAEQARDRAAGKASQAGTEPEQR
ncbi:hypothetical protein AB0L00_00975 [Actinoallomurus sp. NPDC052308]